ncbi:MAG: urease accessory protein [Candidatus Eremiobacteraeota bacterium]|nr:urease accessory protein [Candidatus Eremiobacteraeota bacterium]
MVGLLLGMKHATEADHLAAVATLVTRQTSLAQTLRQGVAWGVGHTLTLMLFGSAVFVLGQAISPGLEQALETAVGIMLIVLGADVLRRLIRDRIHFHVHRHGAAIAHVHAHSHRGEGRHELSAHRHAHARRWPLRALAVGIMHGLAGSAALVVLSLKSVPSLTLGLIYIAVFGIGSIVGMAILSVAIALPLRVSAKFSAGYLAGLHRSMTAAVGAFSCALGLTMVVRLAYL